MKRTLFIILLAIHKTILFFGRKLKHIYFGIGTAIKNRYFRSYTESSLPEWVIDEMKCLGQTIDPEIYPTDDLLSKFTHCAIPIRPKPGEVYRQILKDLQYDLYNYCFMLPWLKRGGADYVALLHIKCATEIPGSKVLVILTEPSDSPWLSKLPPNIDIINLQEKYTTISYDEWIIVLIRLFVQVKMERLHIINSKLGWDILTRHNLVLKTMGIKIFASLFADDQGKYGQPIGYAREYLPRCYRYINKVFSDNETFPKLLIKTYGYPKNLFNILRVPPPENMLYKERAPIGKRILWAGRLDREKRPDLLLQIAKAMPDVEFIVYGEPTLTYEKNAIEGLKKLENVKLMGPFSGAESLNFSVYSAFLYTSSYDGMPNIIIAAAFSSIPIIASIVGGIGELITEETGYPVKNIENIEEYVKAIRQALDNPLDAENRAKKAREYVLLKHDGKLFCQQYLEITNEEDISWKNH